MEQPKELAPSQVIYWEKRLEDLDTARDYALHMLGRVSIEEPKDRRGK